MRALLFGLTCALAPVMASAQSYQAINRLAVIPLNPTDFEVIEAYGEGPRGIWCAAAEFADARMRMGKTQRIYIKSGRGPAISAAGRKGVVFTTNAGSVTPVTSYSVSVRQEGLSLPVNHAIQFCNDYLYDIEDTILYRRNNP